MSNEKSIIREGGGVREGGGSFYNTCLNSLFQTYPMPSTLLMTHVCLQLLLGLDHLNHLLGTRIFRTLHGLPCSFHGRQRISLASYSIEFVMWLPCFLDETEFDAKIVHKTKCWEKKPHFVLNFFSHFYIHNTYIYIKKIWQ